MRLFYDKYNQPIAPRVYLGTPNNKIICAIDGIDPNSFDLKPNLTGTYSLSFSINKYLKLQIPCTTKSGIEYFKSTYLRSNSYDLAGILMRIYIENVGWFIMQAPEEHDDGDKAYKTINATSIEIELQQHDLKNFKINQGTTDSYEMLADGNVEKVGDVEFAKEQIKFYNKKNSQLSLIDLALKASGAVGWSVGYIDTVPETYKNFEDGEYVETQKLLSDEIGSFDIESENLYTFLVQDVAKYFNCICVFDIRSLKINFYHPDNLGKDTGINISFRNLKQSHDISVDEDSIFTRYYVNGDDELGITYVNFGLNYIEDLHHFMNEKYMSASLIEKYKLWLADVESYRLKYITATRNYNKQMSVVTELYNRQPIDDCSTDWSTFSDDELVEAKANYEAQQKGYEQFYVDENGDFDEEALRNSVDADTYYQIRDVIIPSIKIEFENRELPTDADKKDYIDTYKTNWKLYGLDELQVKLNEYKDVIKTCKAGGYDVPYSINSSKTKEVHEKMYAKYLDALNQLDGSYVGGCQEAYNQRKAEIDTATALRDEYDKERTDTANAVDKETWKHKSNGKTYSFTVDDLAELSKLYIDGDYINENMFLTSSDDQVSAIDEQLKLLKAAQDDLYSMSQPQYTYTTSLDNFISQYQYKNYTNNLNLGDYIHLEVDDDYVVKLRVISFDYNPLRMDEKLTIEFSSMIQSRNKRSDLSFLLSNTPSGSKNSSSGNSNNFLNNEGITLTAGLIQKLLSSGAFSNKVNQIINNNFAGIVGGGSISLEELNVKMMNVVDIKGQNAFFEYISSKLIETDKIVADSGVFQELKAFAATIKQAIIGSSSTETGIIINLTSENATISEALIKSLISQYITVGDLKAGNIITDNIKVMSKDGKLQIVGNTFTIYDDDNNPVIQLGQDKNGNYGLVISDENGAILLDSKGLHEGIVPDEFIKAPMIGIGQVTEDKIDKTNIREWKDESGNNIFDVSKLYYGNDKFEVSYSSMKESVKNAEGNIEDLRGTVANLGNGYTVVLSNESQNIPCTSEGVTAATFKIEIPFKGYKGIKQAPCTVKISNLPQGITLSSNKPSTDKTDGLVVLNVQQGSSLGGKSILTGNIVFTCTVDGITIVKKFIWTKSLAGQQGTQGVPGENATTYYTWIKYADSPTTGMSDEPEGKAYIGLAYNKTSQNESSNYSDYEWSLVKGDKGENGKDGVDGKTPVKGVDYFDGKSSYLWIRYASDVNGSNMTSTPSATTKYIGTTSTQTSTAPTNAKSYKWSKYVGDNGINGENGYIHIAYANSSDGTVGFDTTVGTNKMYIGQYTDHNEKDSTNPSDYTWSLIKGEKGDKGADGKTPVKGVDYFDGVSTYLWIRYATDSNGTAMSDVPSSNTKYIGTATTTTSTAPSNASAYEWSKYIGDNGINGKNGYIHIAYSDSADGKTGFDTQVGTNKKYIGQYTDNNEKDSENYTDYTWTLIKGSDGKDGKTPVKGVDYFDGTSSYLWIRYSAKSDGSEMTTTPSSDTKYIGTATTTTNSAPTAINKYKWSKYVGENGTPGKNGYVHIAYADSVDGTTGFDKTIGTGKKYIGQYTDNVEADSDDPTKYTWTLIKGADGKDGKTPVKGVDYFDGTSSYLWIRYAIDSKGTGMTAIPSNSTQYIGTASTTTSTAPASATAYKWSKYVGEDGTPGENGYVHIAYADSADGKVGFNVSVGTNKKYIGQYTDHNAKDSTNPSDYSWTLIKGDKGDKGESGDSLYTWIKYANDINGTNMSDDSTGKDYIGLAYNKATQTESTNPKDYTWSLFRGEKGVQGKKGADGKIYYTWFKYADDINGTNMSKDPTEKKYIGIAYNKETVTESNKASDYTWSLFRGADGIKGTDGKDGKSLFTWIKYSNDINGKNMTDNPDGKKYIGIAYNKTTQTESTNPKDYTWSLIQGADGNDAVYYYLNPSTDVIKKETLISQYIMDESGNYITSEENEYISNMVYDNTLSPSTVTFYSYKIVGNEKPVPYACRFIIQESVNGVSYATKYTSSTDEESKVYTPSTNDLHSIKCILCAAGGITTQLDSQTISILTDSSAITPVIKSFQQQFKEVDFTVDQINKEVKTKVTQKDIEDSINEYDGTTTQKVRDQLVEQTAKIGAISSKVSDVETEIEKKADGSTVTSLSTKVSQMKQDADGFKQTVEKDYAKTNDVSQSIKSAVEQSATEIKTEVKNTYGSKEEFSKFKQDVNSVITEVKDARGDKSSLGVRIGGIESTVSSTNGEISTLKQTSSKIEGQVKTNTGEISQLKVDQQGIATTVQNFKIGSKNLIRNSNNLVFGMYNFVSWILDESGNRIIDENKYNIKTYY